MKDKLLTEALATACLAALLLSGPGALADAPRPSILLILTDDLGYADVGFNGSTDIATPNLDALAARGMVFSAAYVAHPFCGPSRAGLMTGRYPHKIGAQFNLPERGSFLGVPAGEAFIGRVLRDAGYFTGAIGKWHLGAAPGYHPNDRGFDEFYGFLGGGHLYFPEEFEEAWRRQADRGLRNISGYLTPLERNGQPVRETEHLTDALSREAVDFVRRAAARDSPFFLYLAYNAPHVPLAAPAEDLRVFAHIADRKRRAYAAMVHAVDRGVGAIVAALRGTGRLDDTLIVFLSDNGGNPDRGASNAPFRGGKGSVWEGGIRTPMLMHWPASIEAGRRFGHPVLALDLYPTLAGLAGAALPEGRKLDGRDIRAAIRSGRDPREGAPIYALRHRAGFSDAAVRRGEWKAVKVGSQAWRLFNIERDPGESDDLARQHPELLRDMVLGMEKWSWDNAPPRWFHSHEAGARWRSDAMPRFHETFRVEH